MSVPLADDTALPLPCRLILVLFVVLPLGLILKVKFPLSFLTLQTKYKSANSLLMLVNSIEDAPPLPTSICSISVFFIIYNLLLPQRLIVEPVTRFTPEITLTSSMTVVLSHREAIAFVSSVALLNLLRTVVSLSLAE